MNTASRRVALMAVVLLSLCVPAPAGAQVAFGAKRDLVTGSQPAGVAIGDLNGDGRLDLVAVNSGADNVSVLLATGRGTFGSKTDFASGAVPHSVALADLNRDGALDIIVADTGANTVSVLLGTGTGSFGSRAGFATGDAPFYVAVGDLNLDGQPDLAVVNVNANTISILLGRGDGSFGPKRDVEGGAGVRSTAIGDVNGDGTPDVIVADVEGNAVSVLLGIGDGTFRPRTEFAAGAGARFAALADLDGDGRLDVVVVNAGSNTASVFLGIGDGSFQPTRNLSTGGGPRHVQIADINRDGKLDIVTANFGADTMSILPGNGDGTFAPKVDVATGGGPFYLKIGDFDGDGFPDVVTANTSGTSLSVLLNTTPGPASLTPASLTFGATKAGAAGPLVSVTAAQDVTVSFSGGGSAWTVAANQPWVRVTNATGTGAGRFTVSIFDPGNVLGASKAVTATLTFSAPTAPNSPVVLPVSLTIDQTGGAASGAPVGQVDTPSQSAVVAGAISVTGWAIDDVGVARVELWRDCFRTIDPRNACASPDPATMADEQVFIGLATFLAGARPDVEAAFPAMPQAYRAGWGSLVLTNMLPHLPNGQPYGGQGTLALYAYAVDVEGHRTLLGRSPSDHTATSIRMTNDTIATPFGTIDTPGQGQTVSGALANFGWVLTPDSNTAADSNDVVIPVTGATMVVFIDGLPAGTVAYNQCRGSVGNPVPAAALCDDDIAGIFGNATPQGALTSRTSNPTRYRNLDAGRGAIGAFPIDTTTLANGAHSIAWSVTDSAGRVEGIGSRFFVVLNGGADSLYGGADLQVGPLPADLKVGGSVRTVGASVRVDVWARTGFDVATPFAVAHPVSGVRRLEIDQLGRLELWIGPTDAAYLVANGEPRDLPPGSHLDAASGQFTWAPGPGYLGTYHLAFARGAELVLVDVTIR